MSDVFDDLYARASITPDALINALNEVKARWPSAELHKNGVTRNLSIWVDGESIGQVDLLDASVEEFWA